jgi:hypothetical protein
MRIRSFRKSAPELYGVELPVGGREADQVKVLPSVRKVVCSKHCLASRPYNDVDILDVIDQ